MSGFTRESGSEFGDAFAGAVSADAVEAVPESSEHLVVAVKLLIDQPAAMGQRGVLGIFKV